MKKTYLKPDADYIKFYSDEEMTDDNNKTEGSVGVGGDLEEGWD